MKWLKTSPDSPGEWIVAFQNTKHGERGFRHIEVTKDNEWISPSDDQMIYFGNHLKIIASAKLSFPK